MRAQATLRGLLRLYFENPDPYRSCLIGAAAIAAIALIDWTVTPHASIGVFYLFPMAIVAPVLRPRYLLALGALCSVLREALAPFAGEPGIELRLIAVFLGFSGVAFLVSDLYHSRALVVRHAKEKEAEMRLRLAAESESRAVVEATPLAVLLVDQDGRIAQANRAARRLLAPASGALAGDCVRNYLPVPLEDGNDAINVRARLECGGRRGDGEPFLAYVWVSRYDRGKFAIVIWNGTDDMRDREDAGFDSLMTTSRILMGGIAHEIRNFVSVARESHQRLAAVAYIAERAEFDRLGRALGALADAASSGLRVAADQSRRAADLRVVLGEVRILMEAGFQERGIETDWPANDHLPRVRGDQHGLVQILMNLLRNSRSAIENAQTKRIRLSADSVDGRVLLRVSDSGPGVANPERLFEVFQPGAEVGLGLYLARSIALSFGGNLRYEPQPDGASFVLELQALERRL